MFYMDREYFQRYQMLDLRICAGWRPATVAQSPELSNTKESGFWEEIGATRYSLLDKCL